MSFGENIKVLRKARHMTQAALAEAAGISYNSLVNYENGRRSNPPTTVMIKLASALNVPPDVLFVSRIIERNGTLIAEKRDRAGSLLSAILIHDDDSSQDERDETLSQYLIETDKDAILRKISSYLDQLNENGQAEAVKRIEELTEISKYSIYGNE